MINELKNIEHKVNNTISVGVVGSGWVARMRHLPALSKNKKIIIKGIYSLDKKEAKKIASNYKNISICDSLQELINLKIDAIVICTPPKTHAEIAKRALIAGVHVLCEKPMTVDEDDAKELVLLAKEKNLILCPSHNFIFARAMTKAKKLIDNVSAGKILSVNGVQWSSWQRDLPSWYEDMPGGLFFDEGPHLIYLIQSFLGLCSIKNVFYTEKNDENKIFQQYEIDIIGENGSGHVTALYGTPSSEWFIVAICENKTLVLDIFRDICVVIPKEDKRTPYYLMSSVFLVEKQIWSQFISWIIKRFTNGSHFFGLDFIIDKFADSILNGSPVPVKAEDGLITITLLNEIIRKSRQ